MEDGIGKQLRTAREKAGLTIDDAVYLGKIPRDVVHALETENFGFFTSPLYARSFLKQYSNYVGVDPEPWLDSFMPIALIDGEALEQFIDLSTPQQKLPKNREPQSTVESTSGGGGMAAIWMIVLTALLGFGGMKAYQALDKKLSDPTPDSAEMETEPETDLPANKPQMVSPNLPDQQSTALQGDQTITPASPRAIIVNEE